MHSWTCARRDGAAKSRRAPAMGPTFVVLYASPVCTCVMSLTSMPPLAFRTVLPARQGLARAIGCRNDAAGHARDD
jgi:hypothetical protein